MSSNNERVIIIDSRICPLEHAIHWHPEYLTASEVNLVNNVHGFLSGKSRVPQNQMPELGRRLISELEAFSDPIFTQEDEAGLSELIIAMINARIRQLTDGDMLDEELDQLHFSGKNDEIVPAIIDRFSLDITQIDESDAEQILLIAAARQGLSIYLQQAIKVQLGIKYSSVK